MQTSRRSRTLTIITKKDIKSSLNNEETNSIKEYLQSFIHAWNSKNLKTFGDFFNENSEYTDVVGHVAIGKESIINQHILPFENVMKFAKFEMKDVYSSSNF